MSTEKKALTKEEQFLEDQRVALIKIQKQSQELQNSIRTLQDAKQQLYGQEVLIVSIIEQYEKVIGVEPCQDK